MSPVSGGAAAEVLAGRYRLKERIGVGAMGEVWRARDLTLERDVAIKRVRLDGQVEEQAQARFRREAVVMAGLSHPNVVSVYDAGTDVSDRNEIAYLVMELLDGPSCSELIRAQRSLSFGEVQRIGAGVARGLAAAHQAGIVHRDIKPGNVVVSRGVPKIVDFGIARLEQESAAMLTAPETTIGTAAYMSPEQALGKPAGPSSDVYSLGALMMALATGSPPFGASNALALMRAHVDDSPPSLTDLRAEAPPHLSDLIDRMLAKDPSDRPTAGEVARALDEGELAGAPVLPTRTMPVVASPPIEAAAADGPAAAEDSLPAAEPVPSREPESFAEPVSSQAPPAAPTPPGTGPTQAIDEPLPAAAGGAPRRRRGGVMWWAVTAALLVLAAVVALNLLLDDGPSSGPETDTPATAAPTVTPTERIVTPESTPQPPITADPADTTEPGEPTTADLDSAVASAAASIDAVSDDDAREDLQRSWQGASSGLQGANAEAQLRDVIAEAEELAADEDLTADELSAIRSAIEQVIALL